MSQKKLSLCMIVRNAVHLLPDCLASVKPLQPVLDDYVFVDTGSSDETVAYLKQAVPACTLIEAAWSDHFSQARNQALQAACGDWILVLDADERLSRDSIPILKSWVASGLKDLDAIEVLRENLDVSGQIVSWDYLCRLFRNGLKSDDENVLRYFGRVHERLGWADLSNPRGIKKMTLGSIRLRHLADSELVSKAKEAYYLELIQQARQEEPCPYMEFHWACISEVMRSVPAAERLRVLDSALKESLSPLASSPPGWQTAPLAAIILEIQIVRVELGASQEMMCWFESLLENQEKSEASLLELHAESWGHYALACREHRRIKEAYSAFLYGLDPIYPAADPSLGWDSWRSQAFLAELLSQRDPMSAIACSLQGILSGPNQVFLNLLYKQLGALRQANHISVAQALMAIKRASENAFLAQDYQAVLQLQSFFLPLVADRESITQCLLSSQAMNLYALSSLLANTLLCLWPEEQYTPTAGFARKTGSQNTRFAIGFPELSRLWQAFMPLKFPTHLYLIGPAEDVFPEVLRRRADGFTRAVPASFNASGLWDCAKDLPADVLNGWVLSVHSIYQAMPETLIDRLLLLIRWPASRCDVFVYKTPELEVTLCPLALLQHVKRGLFGQHFYHQLDL